MTARDQVVLPAMLTERPQWVTWRYEDDPRHPDKPKKMPKNPRTGGNAQSNNPETWGSYALAVRAASDRDHAGVGYMFGCGDGLVGVDLDGCRDLLTGELAPWAVEVLDRLSSYCEVSPSGRGVKVVVRATIVKALKRMLSEHTGVEVYASGRYFTITGQRLSQYPDAPQDAQDALDWLVSTYTPAPEPARPATNGTRPILPANDHASHWGENKLQWIEQEMRDTPEGGLHNRRLELGKLAGGIVALGLVSEQEAEERIIAARPPASHEAQERKAVRDGIETGRSDPLELPQFPTSHALLIRHGVACCPSCDTPVKRSRFPYPGTDTPGWYCPQCQHQMVWPIEAYMAGELRPNYLRTTTELGTNSASQSGTDSELAPNSRHPLLIHADELDNLPPTAWLITGILPSGDICTLYGASGAGKSHLLLDMALTVAQEHAVVYIAGEALETYKPRAQAWTAHHKRGRGQLYMWTDAVNLMLADAVDTFINSVIGLQPKLIILDTLAMCMVGADENSSQDMGIAVHNADTIRRATGATVVLAHHTGKSGANERGSSALRGACGTMIELTNDDGIISFRSDKARNAAPFSPRYFRLVQCANSVIPLPTARVETRSLPISQRQLEVMQALQLRIFADGATFTQIAEHTEVKKSTLNNAISRLLDRGYISRFDVKNSKLHQLTASGSDFLDRIEEVNPATGEFVPPTELDGLNWPVQFGEQFGVTPRPDAEFVPSSYPVRTQFVPSSVSSFGVPPLMGGTTELRTELDTEPEAKEEHMPPTQDAPVVPPLPRLADVRYDEMRAEHTQRYIDSKRWNKAAQEVAAMRSASHRKEWSKRIIRAQQEAQNEYKKTERAACTARPAFTPACRFRSLLPV